MNKKDNTEYIKFNNRTYIFYVHHTLVHKGLVRISRWVKKEKEKETLSKCLFQRSKGIVKWTAHTGPEKPFNTNARRIRSSNGFHLIRTIHVRRRHSSLFAALHAQDNPSEAAAHRFATLMAPKWPALTFIFQRQPVAFPTVCARHMCLSRKRYNRTIPRVYRHPPRNTPHS